ncbi:endodeoxyribonuclease [Mortierella sp. GBA43]|nr:endodeoxyribonuclease [Mortierella sp. GBA43]
MQSPKHRPHTLGSPVFMDGSRQTHGSYGFRFLTRGLSDMGSEDQDVDRWLCSVEGVEEQQLDDSVVLMDEIRYSAYPLGVQGATERQVPDQQCPIGGIASDEEIDLYSEPGSDKASAQGYGDLMASSDFLETPPSDDSGMLGELDMMADDDMTELSNCSDAMPSSDEASVEETMLADDDNLSFSDCSGEIPLSNPTTAEDSMFADEDWLDFSDSSGVIPSSDLFMFEGVTMFGELMPGYDDAERDGLLLSTSLPSPFMTTIRQPREWILSSLEAIVGQVLRDLSLRTPPAIHLSNRSKAGAIVYDESTGIIRRRPDIIIPSIGCSRESLSGSHSTLGSFARVTRYGINSASRFCAILRVIELIHENVYNGTVSTKRDLFYRDVKLFGSQNMVDKLVEDIACTLQVPRSCLNVVAGSRSIVFGSMRLTIRVQGKDVASNESNAPGTLESDQASGSKEQDEGDSGDDPLDKAFTVSDYNMLMTIPTNMDDILQIEIHPRTKFVLVLEKEAIMDHLISLGFHELHGPCILLTSKGYPDIVTRQLLKHLSDMIQAGVYIMTPLTFYEDRKTECLAPLTIPLLALVDCDPHGVEIYLTYRCGSIQSAYDNANLAVPSLQCLGHVPDDWKAFLRQLEDDNDDGDQSPRQGPGLIRSSYPNPFESSLLPLTALDRTKLVKLLKQHPFVQRHRGWRRQLSKMLMMNCKSEIQSLCVSLTDCSDLVGTERQPKKEEHALIRYLGRKLEDRSLWIS